MHWGFTIYSHITKASTFFKSLTLFTCVFWLFSCTHPSPTIKYRTYEVYANADITLTTENGIILFIPFGGLLSNGQPYYGKVTIILAEYKHLLDSLSRFVNRGKFIHPLQLASTIIDCTDNKGHSLKINTGDGYQMLLLVPLVASTSYLYEDSLIREAEDIFLKPYSFDSFNVKVNLQNLPQLASMDEMLALSRRKPATDAADLRKDAGLAYTKLNSIKTLHQFLKGYFSNAAGQFIRTTPELKHQSDRPDKIPFMGFGILELYNKTGNTNLLTIFRENAANWQNSLLIVDWTGSMQVHQADINALLQDLYLKGTIRHIVLSNDKDDPGSPHTQDDIGFFSIDSVESFEQLKDLMSKSERDYGGGENLQESDYSALIRATSEKSSSWESDYNQIIMLVDNNAPPRDPELFDFIDIKKKIFVIAYDSHTPCDVYPDYHRLVKKFGGLLISEGLGISHNCQDSLQENCMTRK